MTYKQIETSREARLWLGQIVIPAIGVGIALMANPETRRFVTDKAGDVKRFVKSKFKKDRA